MKNKHGFTLIELLAVIVVLAIIALIATPIVMNTINNAKKGAAERSGENYIKQVEVAIATKRLDEGTSNLSSLDGEYTINDEGNLEGSNLTEPLVIETSGNRPTSGTIIVKDGEVQANSTMTIGDYSITYSDGKCAATKNDSNSDSEPEQVTKTYTNGEVVYFNVDSGTKCTSSEAVSTTGTKSGCMKFYAFNDDGGSTVNLLLDHNTTATVAWNSSGSNASGPSEVLTQLKTDTSSWVGTITPSNYTMDQSAQNSKANYTIDYSSYKARLITAQEIATITGNTSWDEKTAISIYYLDSKTTSASTTCTEGNTTGCSYGWLYDRTYTSCTTYGCLNNADSAMTVYGYWTASSRASHSNFAWYVIYNDRVSGSYVDFGTYGVRPVITVLKSKLS